MKEITGRDLWDYRNYRNDKTQVTAFEENMSEKIIRQETGSNLFLYCLTGQMLLGSGGDGFRQSKKKKTGKEQIIAKLLLQ